MKKIYCLDCGKKLDSGALWHNNKRCNKCAKSGKRNPNWLGGKIKDNFGYVKIFKPEHPSAKKNYVSEHRLIVEKYLGRYLKSSEIVHHINGIKDDNRIQNLELKIRGHHDCGHTCIYLKELNELLKKVEVKND